MTTSPNKVWFKDLSIGERKMRVRYIEEVDKYLRLMSKGTRMDYNIWSGKLDEICKARHVSPCKIPLLRIE